MAVITKIWLSQIIGLECDRPGMLVFQRTFCDFSRSHVVGGFVPSATPDAFGPRNEGQFCALIVVEARKTRAIARSFMLLAFSFHRRQLCFELLDLFFDAGFEVWIYTR